MCMEIVIVDMSREKIFFGVAQNISGKGFLQCRMVISITPLCDRFEVWMILIWIWICDLDNMLTYTPAESVRFMSVPKVVLAIIIGYLSLEVKDMFCNSLVEFRI